MLDTIPTATTTITTPVQLLRQKLIKLSLEISDKEQSISIVSQSLEEESELSEQSNALLEANAAQHKDEREQLLQEIHQALAVKKELASKVTTLLQDKEQAESESTVAVNTIRNTNQKALTSAQAAFHADQESRTNSFLVHEANKIKQQTIKALEPEVRRIMELHRESLSMIKAEQEQIDKEMTDNLNAIYQQRIESFRVEAKQEADRRVSMIQDRWNERASTLQDDHVIQLASARDEMFANRETQRRKQSERLRQLSDRHSFELLAARSEMENRLSTLRRKQEQERQAFKVKSREELLAIGNELIQRKAAIEKDIRSRLEQERSHRIKVAEDKLMQQRDTEIEQLIRKSQTELVRNEKSVQDDNERRENMLRSEHRHEMERVQSETRQHQQHLARVTDEIQRLQRRKTSLEREMSSLQDATKDRLQMNEELQSKVAEMETESNKLQTTIKAETESELKRYGDRIQSLNIQLAEMTEQSRLEQNQHEERVQAAADGHEKILDELDAKARADLAALDQDHAKVQSEIEDMSTRVEHLQTMLLRYTEEQKEDWVQEEGKEDVLGNETNGDRTKKRGPARIRKVLKSISRNNKGSY